MRYRESRQHLETQDGSYWSIELSEHKSGRSAAFFRSYGILLLLSCCSLISDAVRGEDIHVILMGGQSNMEGAAITSQAPASVQSQPPLQLYHSSALTGPLPANQWNPLGPASYTSGRFGPELGAGFRLSDYLGATKLAFIQHAEGGTKLTPNPIGYSTTSWYPGTDAADTANWGKEFATFVQTVDNALAALEAEGHTPRIAGMLWVQGEADATDAQAGADYEKNLSLLIRRVREQFKVPEMPFVYAQVLPYQTRTASAEVRQAMADIDQDSGSAAAVTGAFMVPTEGMGEQGDDVHFNTPGQLALGQALAYALNYRGLGGTDNNKTVAYWQLDEASSPGYLLDAVGTWHLDLSVTGTTASALATVPNPDTATFLDGTDPALNPAGLGNPTGVRRVYDEDLSMRDKPFTFEGWFQNSSAVGTHSSYDVIGGTRSALSGYHGWRVIMIDGKIRFLATNDQGEIASILTPDRYDDGKPHHFAAVWDTAAGATGRMSLYLDGDLVDSVPGVGDLGDGGPATKLFAIGSELSGSMDSPQATTFRWEGALDELRFTRSALSPKQFLTADQKETGTTNRLHQAAPCHDGHE